MMRGATATAAMVVALFCVVLIGAPAQAAVGINKTVNFQGKVVNTNGTNVADASYPFAFRIYTGAIGDTASPCAASCIWEESKSITTVNGIFQTNLGDTTTFPSAVDFNSDTLYLAVVFNGDTEMTPRIRLTAVPYAFNADKLGGLDSSAFARLSPAAAQTGFLSVTGNVTSGGVLQANTVDTAAAALLGIGTTNATGIALNQSTTLAGGKNLTFASGAGGFDQSASTGTFATGSGAIGLNGDTTIAVGKTFTANGTSLVKNDGTAAFQVQNSSATSIFKVDTTNARFGVLTAGVPNYSFEVNGDAGISTNLFFAAGGTRTVQVAAAASGAGNDLALKGGAAATAGTNGGNVVLTGGLGSGAGARGVVLMDTPAFSTAINTNCSTSCTIAQANVDNFSAVIVTATATNLTVTMPDPINTTPGRILYLTGGNGSQDFALNLNAGSTLVVISMRQNSTATLIWNGSDWTAAGASSSTTLQSAYDNTLASAGGAEIILNNTASSDGLTIRNSPSNPIMGSVFEVQSSIGTNLLSVNNKSVEYVMNGGAENAATFSTEWLPIGSGTVNRNTVLANVATGQASAEVNSAAALNTGVRIKLSTGLTVSTTYQVSFTGKLASGTFTTLEVVYSRDAVETVPCTTYSTQTLTTTGWSKVTCVFTTDATAATNPFIVIRQTDSTARTYYIDNVSVTLSTSSSTPPNLQVGGGIFGGAVTLFTLDRASSPPVASGNDVYFGSMYYDITSGRIQCYQANGWGACGSAPDNFINLVPEYSGAVLNGTGIGTLTADFCANQSTILAVNTSLCGTGQALNYYKWTSPQATQQTYSIYVTYQLPGGFKGFQSDSTVQLTARTDNITTGAVSYEMFRSEGGSVTACGTETTVTTTANTWQTIGINGNEASSCGFSTSSANNFAIFKINVKAHSNANVYVGTLSFTITNQ